MVDVLRKEPEADEAEKPSLTKSAALKTEPQAKRDNSALNDLHHPQLKLVKNKGNAVSAKAVDAQPEPRPHRMQKEIAGTMPYRYGEFVAGLLGGRIRKFAYALELPVSALVGFFIGVWLIEIGVLLTRSFARDEFSFPELAFGVGVASALAFSRCYIYFTSGIIDALVKLKLK